MEKNEDILERLIKATGCENANQFASYLSKKYGMEITRQKLYQFKSAERVTVTHLLLREALDL